MVYATDFLKDILLLQGYAQRTLPSMRRYQECKT